MPAANAKASTVVEAITAVMRSVPVVKKEDRNASQNFSFRGIDAVLNAVGPVMREHGLIVTPTVRSFKDKQILVGRNQTPMNSVLVEVLYTWIGPDGSTLDTVVIGEAADAGDKAYSKAMSVALRTVLLQTLALPTDEKDPDSDSYERSGNPAETAAAVRTSTAASRSTAKPAKSAADIARDDLLAKVRALKLDPGDVAQLYFAEFNTRLQDETDDARVADFTNRLEPAK